MKIKQLRNLHEEIRSGKQGNKLLAAYMLGMNEGIGKIYSAFEGNQDPQVIKFRHLLLRHMDTVMGQLKDIKI